MRLAVGTRLGLYEIIAPLGAGGMGEVYKARDMRLERVVAIKMLRADKVSDPTRKQRFIQEARAASALNHPNLITIHEIYEEGNIDFLVMEYIGGKTLDHVIPRRGLHLNDTLKHAAQIADALATAHSAGIVHRDIKPSNIMVTDHGRIKVLDFGLAKLTEPPEIGPDQPTRTALANTEEGTVVGSAPYMSPEQASGKPVDARSDIFSFGAVLYEMVTGQKAFHGDTRASVMASVLKDEPKAARTLTEGLPRELERIILRCLRKDLDRRSQSMAEIKLALEELIEESASGALTTVTPATSVAHHPLRLVLTMGAMAVIAAGVVWLALRGRQPTTPATYRLRQVTRDQGVSTQPALSPDGKLLAYASDRSGDRNLDIWVQQVAGGDAIRLTRHRADETLPRFSPDGTQIAFVRRGDGIYVVPSLGGSERLIAKGGLSAEFSPDGKLIAYHTGYGGSSQSYSLYVLPVVGGTPRKLKTGLASFYGPIWSPDSKYLLVQGDETASYIFPLRFYIVPVDGGKTVRSPAWDSLGKIGLSDTRVVAWLKSGQLVFAASQGGGTQNIWQLRIAPGTWEARDAPLRVTAGSGEFPGAASADGRIPYSTGSSGRAIYSLSLDVSQGKASGEPIPVVHDGANARFPTLNRDFSKMVFVSNRWGTDDVWMRDLNSGAETPLVATPAQEVRGIISPDASQLVFTRLENGKFKAYLFPLPGGPERPLCERCGEMVNFNILNWSPDGKAVVIAEGDPQRFETLDVATGERKLLAAHLKYPVHDGILSPDGEWFAFKIVTSQSVQPVFVASTKNPREVEKWIQISGDVYNAKPFWSPRGDLLYYYSSEDNFQCLYARRLDSATKQPQGERFAVRHFHDDLRVDIGQFTGYGLAADRLYLPLENLRSNIWLAEPLAMHAQ